jgi:exodeoxyribonuclease-3
MKLISWNTNGIRACMGKGFLESMAAQDADVICIQETKMQIGQAEVPMEGYHQYWCAAEKKGYSGTAVFTRVEPLSVSYGIGVDVHDHEGRVITCEYDDFYLVNVYVPNSQNELKRLDYRMEWEDDFRAYLTGLDAKKSVIVCGDLNVAHTEIDLKNPKTNTKNAGFTPEERAKMTELLEAGFVDSWRHFNPGVEGVYSWWSYRFKAREKNAGWRIDYFLVSEKLKERMKGADILTDIMGSDHCPVVLELE